MERKFRLVTATTVVKVYEEESHKAQEVAFDTVWGMQEEDFAKNMVFTCGDVKTENDEPKEFALVNEEYNIWGGEQDDGKFALEERYGNEEDYIRGTIDLSHYPIETVGESKGIYVTEHSEVFIPITDTMSGIEIASLIFIEKEALFIDLV